MKKILFAGIVFVVTFVLSSLVPIASAQNSVSDGNPTLEEQLKLARERIGLVFDTHSTGAPCDFWHCPRTMFFYPLIILIGIISGIIILILIIKSRRSLTL